MYSFGLEGSLFYSQNSDVMWFGCFFFFGHYLGNVMKNIIYLTLGYKNVVIGL